MHTIPLAPRLTPMAETSSRELFTIADPIIGIDLGTTNSLVAWCDERGPRILTGPNNQSHCPSVVHIDPAPPAPNRHMEVGQPARDRAVERATHTISSVKRLMGKGLADVAPQLAYLPYAVTSQNPDGSGQAAIKVGDKTYTPQEVSAAILRELRDWAQPYFQHPVRKAVITVPAYFDDAQRQATRDAGRLAGLEVVRIVNEPTAAALAYGLDRSDDATIAVYDLGGGTFDISILRIEQGLFRVLSTNGDTRLGGDDFDQAILRLVQSEIAAQLNVTQIDFPPSTLQALRHFAERVKVELSEKPSATIEIDLGQGRNYRRSITRDEFLALIRPLIAATLDRCKQALQDADITPAQIDKVVMVGGSTYMPFVREQVGSFFDTQPYTALNPMEVVALGAAVQGAILAKINRGILLQDIVPLSLGIETMGGAVAKLITKGRSIPCAADEIFSTSAEGQTAVKIHVLQGERELVEHCRSLGQFTLSGIPPMAAGLPKLRVRFLVDTSGILSVTATEERSGTKAALQIVPSYGLTKDEVDQMVRQSVLNARTDMLAHRLIDLRNQINQDTAAIEKSLKIVGTDIDPAYLTQLQSLMATVRQLAPTEDADAIHTALTAMDHASARLGELAITKTLQDL